MAGITRAQFQRTMFPGLREIIFDAYREHPPEYEQIFNVMNSTQLHGTVFTIAPT